MFWSYRAYTKNCEKMQREITRKVSKVELCHLCAACLIIWVYIPIKFHPNTLNKFGVMEYTNKIVKKNNKKKHYLQKMHFHQKIENQLKKNMASHESRDTEETVRKSNLTKDEPKR